MHESTQRILRNALLVLLLLWGGYTALAYFAVPVHQAAMLDDAGKRLVQSACAGRGVLCNGFFTIAATAVATLRDLGPFVIYGILSLLLAAGFALRTYLRDAEWKLRVTLSPLVVVALFILSTWALLMSIGFAESGGLPMNIVVQPSAQVYPDLSSDGLRHLQENFEELRSSGCLAPTTLQLGGAPVFRYRFLCMQAGFGGRVLSQIAMIVLLAFSVLVLGRAALHGMRLKGFAPFAEGVISAGLGSCLLVAILWVVALLGLYTTVVGWGIVVGIPLAGFVHSRHWLETFWRERWQIDLRPWNLRVILAWLLLTFLAFNFLNVVRPFPIGWDDLGRYMNQPRLLVSYGRFIPSLSTFSWEYVTSLGFLLFGFDSIFGATLSMLINWAAGLLAVMVAWLFGRTYLGSHRGVLAALLYYSLPMVGHFSFADMKVDNAIFAIGSLAIFCAFLAVCPPPDMDEDDAQTIPVHLLLALAGIFAGFAFGMKVTAVIMILAIGAMIFGARLGWAGFLGAMFLGWAVLAKQGALRVPEISGRVFGDSGLLSPTAVFVVCGLLGMGFLAYALRGRLSTARAVFSQVGVFALAIIAAILPWLASNNLSYGHMPPRLELSYANTLAPAIVIDGSVPDRDVAVVKSLPPDLQVDTSNAACVSTSKAEELDRYWGNYPGPWHYIGLPWRAVMNVDTFGYYVTLIPGLLLVPLLLLAPLFWSRRNAWQRLLLGATVFMLFQWMFMANGIVWYGVSMFIGLVVLLEALVADAPTAAARRVTGVLLAVSLLAAFSHRLWQFDTMQNIFEYPLGKVSSEAMEERTIPHYDDIREEIERRAAENPERPYVYRMGTFIPYFIPRNLEVLPLADNQLDLFNCLFQERDAALTLQRLQALGFNSMIFDLNTQTIEKDPNGSLHRKVRAFIDFANSENLGIRIVVNDPGAGIAFILLP